MRQPPRLAEWLLEHLLPESEREAILGDLAERWSDRASAGAMSATLWYWSRVVSLPVWLWGSRLAHLDLGALEIRPVLRRLLKSPGFTLVAVASLGMGIGANTAVFGALRALLYTPLAVERPEELSFVYHSRPEGFSVYQINSTSSTDPRTGEGLHSNVSYPIFERVREAAAPEVQVSGFTFARRLAVTVDDRPALAASAMLISGDGFSTLGVGTVLGRPLLAADDDPGAPPVVVVSHAFWLNGLGGDPGIVGRTIRINEVPVEVVGVGRPGFQGLSPGGWLPPTPLILPLSAQPLAEPGWTPSGGSLFQDRDRYWIRLVARVPGSAPVEGARQEMSAALRQAFQEESRLDAGDEERVNARLLDGSRGLDGLRRDTERPLKILAGVVGLVLLIACANVAGLLLARGESRGRELAARRALGASRLRLGWPLFLESVLVALAGGALSALLAWRGSDLLARALTAGMGAVDVDVGMDGEFLALTVVVAFVAAIASGLAPAVQGARTDPGTRLGTRGGGGRTSPLARTLIVVQVAVAIPLVVGAGLLVGTVGNLRAIDPGFDVSGLTLFRLDVSTVTNEPEETERIFREVRENVERIPDVSRVTFVENVLLSGWMSNTSVEVDGEEISMHMNAVGPGFFDVFRIPILRGRAIGPEDAADAPPVAVVNQAAAEEVFGGRALGRTFRVRGREVTVVGVAGDTRYASLREEVQPTFFDPWQQRGMQGLYAAVRGDVAGAPLEPALREAVARAHPGLPLTGLDTQAAQAAAMIGRETVFSRLLTLFGAFALMLACIGLYGITSFSVTGRMKEMGVRIALGARPGGVVGLVMRQVVLLAALGLVLGLAAAYLASPVLGSLLYGLEPTSPSVYVLAGTALVLVAALAGWLPARRAARADPREILNAD